MNWRDVLAAATGQTPANGWEWPSTVGGRFDVRRPADHDHDPIECTYDALVGEYREVTAENKRLRAVVEAADGPRLGLATTRELLDELRGRIEVDYSSGGGGLDYTTVGGRPELAGEGT